MSSTDPNYLWSGILLFSERLIFRNSSIFSTVWTSGTKVTRCFWETSVSICIMSAPGPSSVKFKTSWDPQKDPNRLLYPAVSVCSAEGSGAKRDRQASWCVCSAYWCLSSLFLSFSLPYVVLSISLGKIQLVQQKTWDYCCSLCMTQTPTFLHLKRHMVS